MISVLIVLLSVYGTAAEIMHNGNVKYHVLEDDIAPADREKNTGAFTFHTSYFWRRFNTIDYLLGKYIFKDSNEDTRKQS